MPPTELTASSRVTVFCLANLTVAYTTRSSDGRALGDIGLVTIIGGEGDGEELWGLAQSLGGRASEGDQARWILTQASRARMIASYKEAYRDLPNVTWTAYIRRRFVMDALFANHDVLLTGRTVLCT